MSQDATPKRSLFRRLWGVIGTVAGIGSGAAIMYLSPLVDRVVKPTRPLANFAVEAEGLTVTFHNRYAGEGWWDFGDGSPLEPATPEQPSVSHTYPKAGAYTAKLMVRNFVGEEHERTVPVEVTVAAPSAAPAAIAALEATPLSADRSAPATFRVSAQTTGADRCIWDVDDRGPEIATDALAKQERLVTFVAPGQHTIILTALNGSQAIRRAVAVQVDAPRGDTLVARLRITDRGTRIEKRQFNETLPIDRPRSSGSSIPIDRKLAARGGFTITEAKLGPTDPAFTNLKLSVSPDRKSVQVTGALTPTSAMLQSPSPPSIPLVLTQERQLKLLGPPAEVVVSLALPGSATLPVPPPAEGIQAQRSLLLELRGSAGLVWQQPLPAKNSLIEFQGKRFQVSAVPGEKDVRLDVTPVTGNLTSREK